MPNMFPNFLDKESYSYEDFSNIVNGYLVNQISDLDMQNWIKYIFKRGMSTKESAYYTKSIIDTGTRFDFSSLGAPIADKHSTGGVGDKVSLVLGPLLAAYGYYVPMIVGTSLGHTGGTLDKLCSIPGYQPYLSVGDFKKNVNKVGISIMGQTQDICPADKKIYELRDRINMIDSYPLICGSIMSKKIAEGIDTLALDIKTGNGAFMHTLDMAKNLGKLLKEIGELNNIKVKVAITDMNQPLGNYSGVACEIIESMEALKGNGPKDLMDVVYYLAEQIILMNENKTNYQKLEDLINSGEAYQKFIDMVEAHGGSIEKFNQIYSQSQNFKYTLHADRDGYVKSFQTKRIGEILSSIGAGRLNNTDGIDNHTSLKTFKKISNKVSKGEPILKFCCASEEKINNLRELPDELFEISESKCPRQELIYQ